jgi:hypothetical protein
VLPYRRTASPSPSYAKCFVSLGWLVRHIDVVASHQKDLTWTGELVLFASLFSKMVSNTVNVRYSSCQIMQLRSWRIRLLVIKVEGRNAL